MGIPTARTWLAVAIAILPAGCSRQAPPTPAPDSPSNAKPRAATNAAPPPLGATPAPSEAKTPADAPDEDGYAELDWLKMMPPADLEALKHPPQVSHVGRVRMKQFGTFNTVAAVTGHKIKLPGYVVPIESDDQGRMTEFFFVPFFGACIHVPPPPPNQIVYARLAKPIRTPEIWTPYWLRGKLTVETKKNALAGSAYTMAEASLVPYDD